MLREAHTIYILSDHYGKAIVIETNVLYTYSIYKSGSGKKYLDSFKKTHFKYIYIMFLLPHLQPLLISWSVTVWLYECLYEFSLRLFPLFFHNSLQFSEVFWLSLLDLSWIESGDWLGPANALSWLLWICNHALVALSAYFTSLPCWKKPLSSRVQFLNPCQKAIL